MSELIVDDTDEFHITMFQKNGNRTLDAVLLKNLGWWSLDKPSQESIAIGSAKSLHWTEALKRALALLEEPT